MSLFSLSPAAKRFRGVAFVVFLALLGPPAVHAERITASEIHPERELMITDPAVVDSEAAHYPGPWSFGGLIEALTGEEKAGPRVSTWLKSWMATQEVNSQKVAPRYGIFETVIQPWQKRDGYQPNAGRAWIPQLRNAPFRLLAIVNRMDLCAPAVAGTLKNVEESWRMQGREKLFLKLTSDDPFGGVGRSLQPASLGFYGLPPTTNPTEQTSAGEGRFVFGAVDDSGAPLAGGWTIIFEYNLNLTPKLIATRDWAKAWHDLGRVDVKDPKFRFSLEALTRAFTHQADGKLAQLRSNEAVFGEGREFRQFSFSGDTFTPAALTQTPAPVFAQKHSSEQRALSQFIYERQGLIRSGVELVPKKILTRDDEIPLLGGSALIPANEPNFYWDIKPQVTREARRIFSLNTCNGCHGGETACSGGMHIHPRAEGAESALSNFLRTDVRPVHVSDPDAKGFKTEYEEMNDRAAILAALLEPNDLSTINALRPILRSRLSRAH